MTSAPPRLLPAARWLASSDGGADTSPGVRGIADLLARRLAADPARPLVTFYDDGTGERVEFSATTFDNWVAKTANMLVDTVGLEPGDPVGMDLPPHWLALVIALATWSAGLELVLVDADGPVAQTATGTAPDRLGALFVAEDRLEATADLAVDETVALSLRPLGGRLARPVPGVLDYAAEVPPHGDRFAAPPPPPEQAALVRAAAGIAAAWELGPADRILVTSAPSTPTGLLGGLLAPLAAGASIVLCRRLDPAVLERRVEAERVSAILAGPDEAEPAVTASSGPAPRPLRLPRLG